MHIHDPLIEGAFLQRLNRFAVSARISGSEQRAHLPNSGSLGELLVSGARLLLARRTGPRRSTEYDLIFVRHKEIWVSVDARLPNVLFAKAVNAGRIPSLAKYEQVRAEVQYGDSRLDFLLTGAGMPDCLVEVKSCTLVEAGIARFPDAPTLRGARHLRELMAATAEGLRAVVLFVVQRPDAVAFAAHAQHDPAFAQTLRKAHSEGVEVYAYACDLAPPAITLTRSIPVLNPEAKARK